MCSIYDASDQSMRFESNLGTDWNAETIRVYEGLGSRVYGHLRGEVDVEDVATSSIWGVLRALHRTRPLCVIAQAVTIKSAHGCCCMRCKIGTREV